MGSGEIEQSIPRGERSSEAGSARQFVADLIQGQRLNVGGIGAYYDKWVQLGMEAKRYIPDDIHQTIRNISLGLGFLFYNQFGEMGRAGEWKQKAFQKRLQRFGVNELVLTYEQGQMLKDAASVVNIAYDPGEPEETPENIKKRTFVFADLEGVPPTTTVVDADK